MMLNHRSTRPWKDLAIFGRHTYTVPRPQNASRDVLRRNLCVRSTTIPRPYMPCELIHSASSYALWKPVHQCHLFPLRLRRRSLPRKPATRRHGTSHATASRAPTLTGVFVKDASIAFFSPDSFETSRGLAATESKREYLKSVAKPM